MKSEQSVEYIHEGNLVAAVEVSLIETESEWSPYYAIADVRKLEAARDALRRGDLTAASQFGRVFELTPISDKDRKPSKVRRYATPGKAVKIAVSGQGPVGKATRK